MDWYVDRGMPTALTELRREVKAQLARHSDASPDDLADAELIAAELLANAVDHSQGPIWVSLEWSGPRPTLSVHDMGELFTLPVAAPDVAQPRGRGLWIVSQLAPELSVAGRRAGKTVEATLPVTRPVQRSVDLPRRTVNPLPRLEEDERIAIGDSGCRVVVHLGEAAKSAQQTHHYTAGNYRNAFPG